MAHLGAWLIVLVAVFGLAGAFGGSPHDDYNIPGTQSQAGTDLLAARFPEMSGANARVVVHGDQALDPAAIAALRGRLAKLPSVSIVSPARMSADQRHRAHLGQLLRAGDLVQGSEAVDELKSAAQPTRDAGLQVEFGGQVPENFSAPNGVAEAVGIIAALVILLLTLRSVVAAGLPLVVAVAGLGVGTAVVGLLEAVTDISATAPTIATMVGLGVGIDYALLLVSRHVEGLRKGLVAAGGGGRSDGHGRALGDRRRVDGARLAVRAEAVDAAGVRVVRVRDVRRRRRGDGGRDHAGAGVVRPGRCPRAPAQGPIVATTSGK